MERNPDLNRTTLRVFTMLQALAETGDGGLGTTKLATLTDAEKSTTSRTLKTLEAIRAVERDPVTGRYRLGILLFELGMGFFNNLDLRRRAATAVRELAEATGETVHLGIPDGSHVIYIDKLEGTNALQMRSRIGMRMPLYSTGLGKAILAFLDGADVDAILAEQLEQRTRNTITDPTALRRELEQIRKRGYAVDYEENEVGIHCVGAPVFDHAGRVVAGVSVAGPAFQFAEERLGALAELSLRAAAHISREIGWTVSDAKPLREALSRQGGRSA